MAEVISDEYVTELDDEGGPTAVDQLKKLALSGVRIPATLHGFRRPKNPAAMAQFDADMLEHVLKRARQ